jgi:hypothetical protein
MPSAGYRNSSSKGFPRRTIPKSHTIKKKSIKFSLCHFSSYENTAVSLGVSHVKNTSALETPSNRLPLRVGAQAKYERSK